MYARTSHKTVSRSTHACMIIRNWILTRYNAAETQCNVGDDDDRFTARRRRGQIHRVRGSYHVNNNTHGERFYRLISVNAARDALFSPFRRLKRDCQYEYRDRRCSGKSRGGLRTANCPQRVFHEIDFFSTWSITKSSCMIFRSFHSFDRYEFSESTMDIFAHVDDTRDGIQQ